MKRPPSEGASLDWLTKSIAFDDEYGRYDPATDTWSCGSCAQGDHEDCMLECGCEVEGCPAVAFWKLPGGIGGVGMVHSGTTDATVW
jgi:hypothetical protein